MPPLDTHITVHEIWHLALPAGATLAGGRTGLHHSVDWVASLRAAFPLFGDLSEGYLALAHLELARKLDQRLTPAYLIQSLHRAHASGLVVNEPIAADDAALADQLGIPVFILPEGSELHAVERDILRALVDREGQLARREMEARQHLQQLFGQGGMRALLNELAHMTEGEVIVIEDRVGEIGHSDGEPLAAPDEAVFPIEVTGQRLGRLVLRYRAGQDNFLHAIYARQTADICGIEMLQRRARLETEERLGLDLIEQLLDEHQDEEAIISRLQRLGYDLAPDRRHLVAALGNAAASNQYVACHDAARDFKWAAERDGANALISSYREQFLVFFSLPASLSEARARHWLRESSCERTCSVGVSRIAPGLAGLRVAVRQALDAWELGQRIVGRASPHYYEELGLYRLLAGLRDREELRRFYAETLGALARYDHEHNTELVHTLEVFFEENANASQTSRALYVHRNTLNYRLQRIVEITGLDLNDAEARLTLQLALKVHYLAR